MLQFLWDISFVRIELSEYSPQKRFVLQRFSVIHISLSNAQAKNFPFVIDYDMRFKPMKPPHGWFTCFCKIMEDFIGNNTFILTHTDWHRINKANSYAFPQTTVFCKDDQRYQTTLLKFHKAIVGNSHRKLRLHIFLYIKQIEVCKGTKSH